MGFPGKPGTQFSVGSGEASGTNPAGDHEDGDLYMGVVGTGTSTMCKLYRHESGDWSLLLSFGCTAPTGE